MWGVVGTADVRLRNCTNDKALSDKQRALASPMPISVTFSSSESGLGLIKLLHFRKHLQNFCPFSAILPL
ncbi:hypothetical protein V6N11_027946 [Hibiscus sabdariffa]|uniref:Uncharacterized protein n=1 Tax=Hibiscus sabdariffa TaxID=183260 RepID=A0ABR2NZK5_9ROSI